MARAGGVPHGRVFGTITNIIGARTSTVVVVRPSESIGSMGQTEETTVNHTEELWLFSPQEAVVEVPAGERTAGDLMALGLDGIDLQKDDRITYGGAVYEVDTVIGRPKDADASGSTHPETDYFIASLVRRSS